MPNPRTKQRRAKASSTQPMPLTSVPELMTIEELAGYLKLATTTPDESLYEQFARLQNRYHFQKWLEGRGVDWRELTDAQLAELAAQALADLRALPPEAP